MLKISKDKFLKFANIVLLICICIFGIYLRTVAYLQHTPFFIDEAALALNIIDKSFLELFGGLDYSQAAPPFYCAFCKIWVKIFSEQDFIFKLVPYLAGVFSVIAFAFLARAFLKNRLAILFAVLIFCINPQLIFMSQFYKPYITDVLFTIIIVLIALNLDFGTPNLKKSLIAGTLFGLSLWCSYPLLFVISGVSSVFLINGLITRNKDYLKNLLFYSLPILGSFIILYFVNLRTLSSHQGLHNYWQEVFYPKTFLDYQLISYFFFEYSGILAFGILFFLGLFLSFKQNTSKAFIILTPIAITILAGFCSLYPFSGRLILFILPLIILILAKSLDFVKNPLKIGAILIFMIAFLFVNSNINSYCSDVIKGKQSFVSENSKVFYRFLKREMRPKDKLYVHHYNYLTFTFYNKNLGIEKQNIINGMISEVDVSKYVDDLNKLPKKTYIWFVLTNGAFSQRELAVIMPWIEKNCVILKQMETPGSILIYTYRK